MATEHSSSAELPCILIERTFCLRILRPIDEHMPEHRQIE